MAGVTAATVSAPAILRAQNVADWPKGPIKIVVPFPPGGSTDPVARIIQAKRRQHFGADRPISPSPHHIEIAGSRYGLGPSDPAQIAQAQFKVWQDYATLWQNTWLAMAGQKPSPVAEAQRGDRRFRHEDWQNKFLFDYLKQSYLIAARHLHQSMCRIAGLDETAAKKVDFYTRHGFELRGEAFMEAGIPHRMMTLSI